MNYAIATSFYKKNLEFRIQPNSKELIWHSPNQTETKNIADNLIEQLETYRGDAHREGIEFNKHTRLYIPKTASKNLEIEIRKRYEHHRKIHEQSPHLSEEEQKLINNKVKRVGLYANTAFFAGATLVNIIKYQYNIEPTIPDEIVIGSILLNTLILRSLSKDEKKIKKIKIDKIKKRNENLHPLCTYETFLEMKENNRWIDENDW